MRKLTLYIAAALVTSACHGNEVKRMLENEIPELKSRTGREYIQHRDSLLKSRIGELSQSPGSKTSAPPDLVAALRVRASHPEKAEKYTSALLLKNTEYLHPRSQVKNPNSKQLSTYLATFGPEFSPLIEEYLFQLPEHLDPTVIFAAINVLLEQDSKRAESVAVESFRKFKGNEAAQEELAAGIEAANAVSASPLLWEAYKTAKSRPLKETARYVLAKFRDPPMKTELERLLRDDKTPAAEINSCLDAYLLYLDGDEFAKNAAAYSIFILPRVRLSIAENLTPTDPKEAKSVEKIIAESKDKAVTDRLKANVEHYRRMAGDH